MSEQQPELYKLDHSQATIDQIRAIAAYAKTMRRSRDLGRILRKAMHLLQTDPHGWGDPVYRSKTVDAVAYRGVIRPLVFQYSVYEAARTVVLVGARLFADFD
jgi:hypothetical protein